MNRCCCCYHHDNKHVCCLKTGCYFEGSVDPVQNTVSSIWLPAALILAPWIWISCCSNEMAFSLQLKIWLTFSIKSVKLWGSKGEKNNRFKMKPNTCIIKRKTKRNVCLLTLVNNNKRGTILMQKFHLFELKLQACMRNFTRLITTKELYFCLRILIPLRLYIIMTITKWRHYSFRFLDNVIHE